MAVLFWLSKVQVDRMSPYFPRPRGIARVDDLPVLSGILPLVRNGLRWRDAPPEYASHNRLYKRLVRWTRAGVFADIFGDLAEAAELPDRVMIDSTHLKAHWMTAGLLVKTGGAAPWADQGRPELQAAYRVRPPGSPVRAVADRGVGQRPQSGRGHVRQPAASRSADRRS